VKRRTETKGLLQGFLKEKKWGALLAWANEPPISSLSSLKIAIYGVGVVGYNYLNDIGGRKAIASS
jgi:hypothetical protein